MNGASMQHETDSSIILTQLLGRVSSEEPFVFCEGDPYGNSTRWVFDVEQCTGINPSFSFQLRSWNGKGIFAPIASFSFAPLSDECWDARPFIEQTKLPSLRITARPGYIVKYRVAIDLIHSTSR